MAQGHFHQIREDLRQPYQAVREAIPAVISGYNSMHAAAFAEAAAWLASRDPAEQAPREMTGRIATGAG